jgi:tRNA A37 threonylcarbamoyltransferase TsaD
VVSGGVASNSVVRTTLDSIAQAAELPAVYPPVHLCTDNGVHHIVPGDLFHVGHT